MSNPKLTMENMDNTAFRLAEEVDAKFKKEMDTEGTITSEMVKEEVERVRREYGDKYAERLLGDITFINYIDRCSDALHRMGSAFVLGSNIGMDIRKTLNVLMNDTPSDDPSKFAPKFAEEFLKISGIPDEDNSSDSFSSLVTKVMFAMNDLGDYVKHVTERSLTQCDLDNYKDMIAQQITIGLNDTAKELMRKAIHKL